MRQRGDDRSVVAVSAAAIYSGAAFVGIVESLIPGGEGFSVLPAAAALVISALMVLIGPRMPRLVLAALGPLGVAMIGVAIATTTGYSDSAVLYMWPAVWMAFFFGLWGTALIVGWIGVVHGAVLLSLPAAQSSLDRWVDVVTAVVVVATVVRVLAARNERLVDRLEDEARVDPLTGLLNRRGLEERMDAEISRATRECTPLGVVALDLDHFKRVNDEHGHELGDRVLVWLGALLKEQARGVDIAARVGGEEFIVLLPRADDDAACTFAERVRRAVGDGYPESGRGRMGLSDDLELTLSAGVASSVPPVDGHALLAAADQALYAAKRSGRNRSVVGPRGDAAEAVAATA
jgi:diguanylate cyclase (GGDEF)-like protein